ncbi:hypothetical protein AB685_19310 [Bacillus sp. LL01]|uniref:general stress protein n=1 Tax=Bacillus sp. LL01 TaxID=1665556 RepID=UPI00064CF15A|nr:general stress protein [Bacillus sp. LL01]KMJ56875.1 hypothetical protein AB685_19310 [Bacillus sp. LL01]
MKKKALLGVYDTEMKARNVVEGLIVQGYRAEEIVVVALGDGLGSDYPDGTRIERIVAKEDDSVVDKIKHSLLPEEAQTPPDVGNRLLKLGLSDRDAPMYATDVENGRILVLSNEKETMEARTMPPCTTEEKETSWMQASAGLRPID